MDTILAKGSGWLAADKPHGMSVHNDPGGDLCSHLQRTVETDRRLADSLAFDPEYGVHAVHRLDRDTSGVVLLACRRDVFRKLSQLFAERRVSKSYRVLLHGCLAPSGEGAQGEWHFSLTKAAGGRRDPAGRGKRAACTTRWRIRTLHPRYTLVECLPVTGRKHQIRRHAKLAGHPVVGDPRYGSPRSLKYLEQHYGMARMLLHAEALTFQPPEESSPLTVKTALLPPEFESLLS